MALADQSERVRKQRRQPAVGSFPAWREVAVPALGRAVLDRSRVLSFARERFTLCNGPWGRCVHTDRWAPSMKARRRAIKKLYSNAADIPPKGRRHQQKRLPTGGKLNDEARSHDERSNQQSRSCPA